MTAVALQTSYSSSLTRHGWHNSANSGSVINMTPEYVAPRRTVHRTNSNSSLSSNSSASSTATISAPPQVNSIQNGDSAVRRKTGRGLWPGKAEPVSGLSTARPSVSAAPSGASAASAISALQAPSQNAQSHAVNGQGHANGVVRSLPQPDVPAVLYLLPMNGTFERKTITVPYAPEILKIGRQTNVKTLPTPANGYFDSKVLSRQHAEVWADQEGKIWIRDVRSSNGTFVNGKRLSPENRDSEPHALKEQDTLELGIDIVSEDGKSIVHSKVAARVEHAGTYGTSALDLAPATELNGVNGLGQQLPPAFRTRPSSQGSISSGRFSSAASGNVAAYHAKWLQPVTMEQIAKKLNVELRQARLQSQDLHNTADFVNAVMSHQNPLPVPEPQKIHSPSKAAETKARFSDPPGPPPSQPLPEKPDAALRSKLADLPALQPLLRRSDTEKPLLSSDESPTKSDSAIKINSLVEALTTAQREISNQSERLKSLEESLEQEREARSTAEQRAESLSAKPLQVDAAVLQHSPDVQESPVASEDPTETASRLQEKCDLMTAEMDSMRMQMEKYRQRAELAEQESENNRQSLADMVVAIRRRDAATQKRKALRIKTHRAASSNAAKEFDGESKSETGNDNEVDDDLDDVNDELSDQVDAVLKRQATAKPASRQIELEPSSPALSDHLKDLTPAQLDDLGNTIATIRSSLQKTRPGTISNSSRTQDQLAHSAPYVSIVGVVILGMGMMAYLNGWQKVIER